MIEARHLAASLLARLLPAANQADRAVIRPGTKASNVLRVAANVVDGETVTIGSDVYEVDIINTDSAVNTANVAGAAFDAVANPAVLTLGAAPATAISVGDYVRIENEIMQVLRKNSTTEYIVSRARGGTTIATHAQNLDVFVSNAVPTNISVPLVTTLTPAVFTPALAAVINNALAGGERSVVRSSTIYGTFVATSLQTGAEMLLEAITAGVLATATTETLGGANNAWSAATVVGGSAAAVKKFGIQARVPTATEVALGVMTFVFDFTPSLVRPFVHTTATGITEAWNGGFTITGGRVRLDNAGATDWAATSTVTVQAFE